MGDPSELGEANRERIVALETEKKRTFRIQGRGSERDGDFSSDRFGSPGCPCLEYIHVRGIQLAHLVHRLFVVTISPVSQRDPEASVCNDQILWLQSSFSLN